MSKKDNICWDCNGEIKDGVCFCNESEIEAKKELLSSLRKDPHNKFIFESEIEAAAKEYAKQFDYPEDSSADIDFKEGVKWVLKQFEKK